MAENDKSGWIKYLVGTLVTLTLFVAIPTIVNAVIENDRQSRTRDDEIKKELATDRKELGCKLELMMCRLSSIETELKFLNKRVGAK